MRVNDQEGAHWLRVATPGERRNMQDRHVALWTAAAAQAAEAALVFVASVLSAVDTAAGKSYQLGSGIALTVIGFGTALALGFVAVGLARAQLWSRTPALLSQLFTLIVGIYLLQSHRVDWGTLAVVVAVIGFAALLLPQSQHMLRREPRTPPDAAPEPVSKPPAARKTAPRGKPAPRG
jgi:hypothetical protein